MVRLDYQKRLINSTDLGSVNIIKNRGKRMKINHLQYVPIATYSDIFGHKMDDKEFKHMLSKIGSQKAIAILCRLSSLHNSVCSNILEATRFYCELKLFHSSHIFELGGDVGKYNQFKTAMCPQSIFLLEKLVLIHCPVENQLRPITADDFLLMMDALLIANDMLPKDDVDGHETEYLYLTLYHNTHRIIQNQIARAFYIFSTIAKHDQETTELLERYEQEKGFSVEDRLAVLFNCLTFTIYNFTIKGMFSTLPCVRAEGFDAKQLAPVYDKIMQSICSDYEKIQKKVSGLATQVWNFEPIYLTPFVRIGDSQFAFSETTIIYQMWEGLYWDIRFSVGEDGETFMTRFGKPFEHYIQEITCAAVKNTEEQYSVLFQKEFLYMYKGKSKASSDCYLRIGDVLIVVEVKAKSPHSKTLTGVSRKAIDVEVNELMVDPVNQVLDRLNEINSNDNNIPEETLKFFYGVEQTIILSVTMEKVQPIGELLFAFDTKVKQHITNTNVVCYHNLSVEDYEVICNLIENCPDELPTILTSWYKDQRVDKRSAVVLVNYLSSCGKPYICSQYISDLFVRSLSQISLRTFGKDFTSVKENFAN